MMIEFSVGNYRSINRIQTLSFKATGLVSEDKSVDEKNIIEVGDTRNLKIAAIYGANGGGKSNVLEAFQFFSNMVVSSIEKQDLAIYAVQPFAFDPHPTIEKGGYFQVILLIDGSKFRYGFTVSREGDIQQEWLFGPANVNETYYFKRDVDKPIDINKEWFSEGNNLPFNKLRDDSLFLTFCSSYDGEISQSIRDFFKNSVSFEGDSRYPTFLDERRYNDQQTDILIEDGRKEIVLEWLREIGLFYDDITVEKSERRSNKVRLYKKIYDANNNLISLISFSLNLDESQGTNKYYRYIGLLINKFENGGILVSDEIDNNFHPSLLKKLISLFQNPNVNKANAQLLFTSHDTNLMDPDCMRRDQFYFAEKTELLDTKLYSLSDLKGIRNNADFARQYLSGTYGALPVLGNYLEESQNE
jgi:uncharacterized protein